MQRFYRLGYLEQPMVCHHSHVALSRFNSASSECAGSSHSAAETASFPTAFFAKFSNVFQTLNEGYTYSSGLYFLASGSIPSTGAHRDSNWSTKFFSHIVFSFSAPNMVDLKYMSKNVVRHASLSSAYWGGGP